MNREDQMKAMGLGSCCSSCAETGGNCASKKRPGGHVAPPAPSGGGRRPEPAPSPPGPARGYSRAGSLEDQMKALGLGKTAPKGGLYGTPAQLAASGLGATPSSALSSAVAAFIAGLGTNSVPNGTSDPAVVAIQQQWNADGSTPTLTVDGLYGGCAAAAAQAVNPSAPTAYVPNQSDGGYDCASPGPFVPGPGGGGPPPPPPPPGGGGTTTPSSSNTGLIVGALVVGGVAVGAAAFIQHKKKLKKH